jgi:hypothetical protein
MDNLKLVGKQEEELQKRVKTSKIFSGDSYMEFRLDMCAKIVLKKKRKKSTLEGLKKVT